ncbi:MAG: 2-phosphosulfolactate phosphatase [Alphaproteobacteria bacterium]|nr:2-phosphosulfolactate phosphatase [Alphaproteobacteria bacterium]
MTSVWITSLDEGLAACRGTVVVIDVFRAFTTAAMAFRQGARRIVVTDSVTAALALRDQGIGTACMGEIKGAKAAGFDYPNSPWIVSKADFSGQTVILATSNGTAGLVAASGADRLYASGLVTADATAAAIRRAAPESVTLAAMGELRSRRRTVEDELCAHYIAARLAGRAPDRNALAQAIAGMAPPPNPALLARGDYFPEDRTLALDAGSLPFALRVTSSAGLLIVEPEYP